MKRYALLIPAMAAAFLGEAPSAELRALPEFLRPDPFGGVVAADRGVSGGSPERYDAARPLVLRSARGGYCSFHLVVKDSGPASYEIALAFEDPTRKLQADLFREWFHLAESDRSYYPDALVPVTNPHRGRLPDPDNRIDRQSAQAFWVDLWVPADAVPGRYRGQATLAAGSNRDRLPIELVVLAAVVPDRDVVTIDHNSYGSSWLAEQYPGTTVPGEGSFRLTHLYHRLFYEHRGVMHQLGYGHGGRVIPEFAPALSGSGRSRKVESWDLYDRHYGPLLDGSAFAGSRRPARPIPFVYLPINPEWPASFLGWREPGYEAEFVAVVAEMERHFRAKGWTQTRFELFFNHKKRYKAFPWDGDEARFPEDDRYPVEYGRLLRKAVPDGSPVRFVFRADVSWAMERQFRALAGIVNFWVCSGSMLGWFREAPRILKERGDVVWIYGEAPRVTRVSSAITESPLRAWLYGVDGWVHWLAVSPGADPWFHFDGGATALAYSGARFGVAGPIPSLRLKLQRNAVADLALLDALQDRHPLERLREEAARRYDRSSPGDWWTPRPALADTPPWEWNNTDIDEATRRRAQPLEASAWQHVREYILDLAAEGK